MSKDLLYEFAEETAEIIKRIADDLDRITKQDMAYKNALILYMTKYGNQQSFAKDVVDEVNRLASEGYAFKLVQSGLKEDGSFDVHFILVKPEDQTKVEDE